MTITIKRPGLFQVWSYTVSHSQLLLRKTRDENERTEKQVDVLFKNVSLMRLAQTFQNIKIEEVYHEELGLSEPFEISAQVGRKCYRITGDSSSGFVVAGAIAIDESERSYWEVSPLLEKMGTHLLGIADPVDNGTQ